MVLSSLLRRFVTGSLQLASRRHKSSPEVFWENGYVESFSSLPRDELLNREFVYSIREAQIFIES